MQVLKAETRIVASPAVVWEVLTALNHYQHWNSQFKVKAGPARPGGKRRLLFKPLYHRSISTSFRLTQLPSRQRIHWSGINIVPGLLKMELLFSLNPTEEGNTLLHLNEGFTGILSFMIKQQKWQILARKCFLKLNAEIKRRAELLQLEEADQQPATLSA
jgi:hypothetical protein